MDESTFSGVSEGASVPSSGESSSPMAADSGGFQEAAPAQVPGADSMTAQDATQGTSGDATAQESQFAEPPDPFDADVETIPEHQRDKFNSLLQHKKNLEKDLRPWKTVAEQYGDPQTIAEKLAQLEGLGSYATNEIGQTVIDPATGIPQMTTAPWLAKMAESSPGMVDQLSYDLWNQKGPDGQTYGAKLFWSAFEEMGLDPNRVKDYAQLPASQVAAAQVTADELTFIDESLHGAYNYLTKAERAVVQEWLKDPDNDPQVVDYLRAAEKRQQNEQRLEAFDNHLREQERTEINGFWQDVHQSHQRAVQEANNKDLAALTQQITSQVQFSSDPKTNAIQGNMVTALIAAMVTEETRFAVLPILEQIGVTYDPQLDQMLANATQAEKMFVQFSKIEEKAKQNPKFAQYRNSMAMSEARREADRLRQQAMAKVSSVALKIAKQIAGGNQGIREASAQDLAKINSRPSVGNGAAGGRTMGPPAYPKGREFDLSYQPN